MRAAEFVDYDQAALVAFCEDIALLLKGRAKGFRRIRGLIGGGDFGAALVGTDAGFVGLRLLGERGLQPVLFEGLPLLPRFHAGRQFKAEFMGKLAANIHQPAMVEGQLDRPIFSMSMRDQTTWQCSRPSFTWKTTARGWPVRPSPYSMPEIAS